MGILIRLLNMIAAYRFRKKATCGKNTRICWTANVTSPAGRHQVTIGNDCAIWGRLVCNKEGRISIGSNTTVRYRTLIGSAASITIGDYGIISNNVTIFDHNSHPTDPAVRIHMCKTGFEGDLWDWKHADKKPIVIEDNVWIGQNSLICKGVRIGRGAIVAANAVVTKDVPPYSIVAGNPAVVVKTLEAPKDAEESAVGEAAR